MRPEDLTVEVRDRNLNRKGQILPEDLDLKAVIRWAGVGEWTLNLPQEHPMVEHLMEPGSGIVVTGPTGPDTIGPIFSGPRIPATRKRDQKDPEGTLTFKGVTDDVILDDTLAFPSPDVADPAAQTAANDTRTGQTESLMRQYVAYNACYTHAPAGRLVGLRTKFKLAGSDLGRGVNTAKSPRFQNLLELLQELAAEGTLGFRVLQVGAFLEFQVVPVLDLRATIRLDLENGTITSEEVQDQGPTLTYAVVAGQGEGIERTMITRTRDTQATEELQWGRRIERFFDRRDTDNLLELQAKGDEELATTGAGVAVKLIPSDEQTMRYLIDWNVGDWVTAVVNGQETWSVVTEAVIVANSKFTGVGASIGDVTSFTPESRAQAQNNKNDSRIGYLERASAGPVENSRLPGRLQEVGQQVADWDHADTTGFYWGLGSATNSPEPGVMFTGNTVLTASGDLAQTVRAVDHPQASVAQQWVRYRVAGAWSQWRKTLERLRFQGTIAEREAYTPNYGDLWDDTEGSTKRTWKGSSDGRWRILGGKISFGSTGWNTSGSAVWARTDSYTFANMWLEPNEVLGWSTYASGNGFEFSSLASAVNQPSGSSPVNLAVVWRKAQFHSASNQPSHYTVWIEEIYAPSNNLD